MDALNVPQLIVVRQFALLRVTALMERYSRHGRGVSNYSGPNWNWGVQKLFKKMKSPENKGLKGRVIAVNSHVLTPSNVSV